MSAKKTTPVVAIEPLFLEREHAACYLSISANLLEKIAAQADGPKPRKLSSGRVAWLVDDLKTWGRDRPVSDLLPPSGSGYGRAGKAGAA